MVNNKKAFTLIEVIGIVTILALMLLLAVPAMTKTLKTSIEAYSQTKIEGPEIEGVAGARYQLVFPLGYSNLTSQAISRVVENSSKEYNSETGVLKFYVTVNNMSDSAFSYEEEFYILFFSKASAM